MTNAYTISQLKHGYGDTTVLDIDQYTIRKGTVLAMVGPNGAGKSTLLDLLAFSSMPNQGQITFHDEKVDQGNISILRKRIAYVQQNPYLFNMSVKENIGLGLKWRKVKKQLRQDRTMDIIEQFNLGSLANKRVHDLSGGEAQRVAIARSLILEPDVLILDEPFTYLDEDFITQMEKIILSIKEDGIQTLILSIHDFLRAQRLSEQVWSLHKGHLIRESEVNYFHGKFKKDKGVFDTGKLEIDLPEDFESCEMIAIEAIHIVLSITEVESSMRNRFQGRIKSIDKQGDHIQVRVVAGELFTSVITGSALSDLQLKTGDTVWLSFKSTAVRAL